MRRIFFFPFSKEHSHRSLHSTPMNILLLRPVLNVFSYFISNTKKKQQNTHSVTWYKSLECNYSTQLGTTPLWALLLHTILFGIWIVCEIRLYPPCGKTMIMCIRNALSSVTKKKYVFRATNCIFNGRQCEGLFFFLFGLMQKYEMLGLYLDLSN